MSIRVPDDAMLPLRGQADPRPARLKPAVFLPIAIALLGVAAVLLGGLPVRDPATVISKAEQTDPVVTGSVQPASFATMSDADKRHALAMLDR
jgi:hypothetical protein